MGIWDSNRLSGFHCLLTILPDKFKGVDILEDVFENGVIYYPSGIGDSSKSVHAKADDQEAGLRQMKISSPLGSLINYVIQLIGLNIRTHVLMSLHFWLLPPEAVMDGPFSLF